MSLALPALAGGFFTTGKSMYTFIYLLFFGFPSHLGDHRAPNRVPYAVQWVLISFLFYT